MTLSKYEHLKHQEKQQATWLLLIGIILISANLRGPLTSVGPLITFIRDDLSISNTLIGSLTTLPLLAFAFLTISAENLRKTRDGTNDFYRFNRFNDWCNISIFIRCDDPFHRNSFNRIRHCRRKCPTTCLCENEISFKGRHGYWYICRIDELIRCF